jgi:hypothetical protein
VRGRTKKRALPAPDGVGDSSAMTGLRFVLLGIVVAGCAQAGSGADDDVDRPDAQPDSARLEPRPDAPPGTPDAFVPGQPDAFIPGPPDAAPACTTQQVQLLLNPGFDGTPLGVNWTQIPADPMYPPIGAPPASVTPLSAPNILWMGGLLSAVDVVYQDVAIPATATALELRVNRWIATEELGGMFDTLTVQIRNTSDATLASLATWSNANTSTAFVNAVLPAPSAYPGQTIRVHFRSATDSTLNTNFFIDSLQLVVTACL